MIFLLFSLLTFSLADNCPSDVSKRTSLCSSLYNNEGCSQYFEWKFDSNMDYNDIPPKRCANGPGQKCITTETTCTPPCKYVTGTKNLKKGGPSGAVCNDFSIVGGKQTCIQSYMNQDGGDRWCYWRDAYNYCYRGLVCYT